jgi:hypothetical protein
VHALQSVYDFYRLDEPARIAMVGHPFREASRMTTYFPVNLTADEFNYDSEQGLIFVTEILKCTTAQK